VPLIVRGDVVGMAGVTTMVEAGRHRIEVTVFGRGLPAVVIEPALGGRARDWYPIAEAVAADTTVVAYDRAPYGASSRATDERTPDDVAADLQTVLESLGIRGPLVLVGHSLGGLYVRGYAARHMQRVAGMVLVDSSHEGQRAALRKLYSVPDRVRVALTIPQMIVRSRRWRGGADRRSAIREYRMFCQLDAGDQALGPGALGGRPLIVITRAPRAGGDASRFWPAWRGLHQSLAQLSANSRHVVSGSPDHYLNRGDPQLLIGAIAEVVQSARTGAPLQPATASEGD
jgi:pimeloyl-ACP methyl ester carboxylesterase